MGNGICGQCSRGGDQIALLARCASFGKLLNEGTPKFFAACGLWRSAIEKRTPQKPFDNMFQNRSRSGDLTIAVIWNMEKSLRQSIDHHVSWPRIERQYLVGSSARRNRGEIRNPPDVLNHPSNATVAIKQAVKKRYQRRALASRCHVCRTKS